MELGHDQKTSNKNLNHSMVFVLSISHTFFAGPSGPPTNWLFPGADVIKVEPKHEPDMMRAESQSPAKAEQGRGTEFICQNGNKRSLSLDLTAPNGLSVAKRLIESADVLVENYRYGVMDRYGAPAIKIFRCLTPVSFIVR
ncbi:MAG: hypothetical protein CM1200mP24_10050 [Gammaproteobacteria bacterium]|nr:MAG: hypothetical protein CM1200mP24_10050 [Gammaproteobacteria bacterium]